MKRDKKMFVDGYASIYKYNRKVSSFQAVKNATEMSDLILIGKLGFDETSKRQSDIEFAESVNRSLSLKIRTRLRREWCRQEYCLVINGYLYDVITIDEDRLNGLCFWYLEEVRQIAE